MNFITNQIYLFFYGLSIPQDEDITLPRHVGLRLSIHAASHPRQTYPTYTAAEILKLVTACNLPSPQVHYDFTDKRFPTQPSHFCSEPSTDYASLNLFRSRDNSESINRSAIWYQPSVRSTSQPKVSTYTDYNNRQLISGNSYPRVGTILKRMLLIQHQTLISTR